MSNQLLCVVYNERVFNDSWTIQVNNMASINQWLGKTFSLTFCIVTSSIQIVLEVLKAAGPCMLTGHLTRQVNHRGLAVLCPATKNISSGIFHWDSEIFPSWKMQSWICQTFYLSRLSHSRTQSEIQETHMFLCRKRFHVWVRIKVTSG